MDAATKQMILGWIEMHKGDAEGVAKWMRDALRMSLRDCRRMVSEAQS